MKLAAEKASAADFQQVSLAFACLDMLDQLLSERK